MWKEGKRDFRWFSKECFLQFLDHRMIWEVGRRNKLLAVRPYFVHILMDLIERS